ncbi:hypothetical protein KL933_003855 [Ogataea haglerorum]|uniref:Uncharacterized protein n=1 Tax=Ogataea haglerorum TaxID=1937702 RepID=A0AAN6HZN4_9ASCO|nr:uncharacterized protein KL911_002516 [Ogataea haglerorum]KAG7696577.1 hypothetical protein KL951_003033 [Ogataea haglerorum]KAG7725807.1 hypothetical protein KL933_003855 [Ogataea haglerorum]KAG7738992.1 hypothetical protein KL923_002792 [Ogataea haglerorum]KAG7754040.1 hypothetical protein KL911_002516 [Ogataea haglerorum]KAG7758712.1 hypothetical protein KL947_002381 [Ogataea haglerorum]
MSSLTLLWKTYRQLNPTWMLGLGIIAVLVVSASMKQARLTNDFVSQLSTSKTLNSLMSCSGSYRSIDCLKRYHKDILREFAPTLIPIVHAELKFCLNGLQNGQTGADALLGVHSCLSRADKLNSAFQMTHAETVPFNISLFAYVSITALSITWLLGPLRASDQEPPKFQHDLALKSVGEKLDLMLNDISGLKEKILGLEKAVCNLELFANSFTGTERSFSRRLESLLQSCKETSQQLAYVSDPFPVASGSIGRTTRPSDILLEDKSIKVGNKTFNIATKDGLDQWKTFVHQSINKKPEPEPIVSGSENDTTLSPIDLKALRTTDENGKPFRRIFVPNRGWVSSKKLHQELQLTA